MLVRPLLQDQLPSQTLGSLPRHLGPKGGPETAFMLPSGYYWAITGSLLGITGHYWATTGSLLGFSGHYFVTTGRPWPSLATAIYSATQCQNLNISGLHCCHACALSHVAYTLLPNAKTSTLAFCRSLLGITGHYWATTGPLWPLLGHYWPSLVIIGHRHLLCYPMPKPQH